MTDSHSHPLRTVSLDELVLVAAETATGAGVPDPEDCYEDLWIDVAGLVALVSAALAPGGPPLTIGSITDEALFKRLITGDHRTPVRAWALDEVRTVLEADARFQLTGELVQRRHRPGDGRGFPSAARAA